MNVIDNVDVKIGNVIDVANLEKEYSERYKILAKSNLRAMSEVKRIIKKNGLFFVNVPWNQNLNKYWLEKFSHIRTFNIENLCDRFSDWEILDRKVCPRDSVRNWLGTINLIMVLR